VLDYVKAASIEFRKDSLNDVVIKRKFDTPLIDQIKGEIKSLEIIPGLKVLDFEVETYNNYMPVSKKYIKDVKLKNKQLDSVYKYKDSEVDKLIITFGINMSDVEEKVIQKELFVFRQDRFGRFFLDGKRATITNQIVDNSTYIAKDGSLCFRTPSFNFPVTIRHFVYGIKCTDGTEIKGRKYEIMIFNKPCNILHQFMAKFGVDKTIKFFSMDGIVNIVPEEFDKGSCLYYQIGDGIYVELNKKLMDKSQFIKDFFVTLVELLRDPFKKEEDFQKKKRRKKYVEPVYKPEKCAFIFSDLYEEDFWLEMFSQTYSNKKSIKNGLNGLISFESIISSYSAKKLPSIKPKHKRSIYHLIRFFMTNYALLKNKNNHSLDHKRIRNSEIVVSYWDAYLRGNMNSMLNSQVTAGRLEKFLNTITPDALMRATKKDMFRYERFNDFTVAEISRYTMKGVGSIKGGKHKTSISHRALYPSYIGRIDINSCSSTDPGLSGYLCCNAKITDDGRFSDSYEPESFDKSMNKIREKDLIKYGDDKRLKIETAKVTNANGNIFLKLKGHKSDELKLHTVQNKPYMARMVDGKILIFKTPPLGKNGGIKLTFKKDSKYYVDEANTRTSRRTSKVETYRNGKLNIALTKEFKKDVERHAIQEDVIKVTKK
jgi:hypothetical protein